MNAPLIPSPPSRHWYVRMFRWVDTYAVPPADTNDPANHRIEWLRVLPFLLLHVSCFAVIWVGWSWTAVAVAVALYFIRMFAITGIYHRYFSHRTYKTSRFWQFCFAVLGNSSVQRGPLWWAAHHRHHHRHSDDEQDVHSPSRLGFWRSHMLWFMNRANHRTQLELIPDFAKFPELVWLDRYDVAVPVLLGVSLFMLGWLLHVVAPGLNTNGLQLLVWGLSISTVACAHGTFTINSLSHVFGSRRYQTTDTSRNNFLLALITLGEGWHNNHHHYQSTVRQGFFWYEIDITFYILKTMSWVGIISDLKPVPAHIYAEKPRAATKADSVDSVTEPTA